MVQKKWLGLWSLLITVVVLISCGGTGSGKVKILDANLVTAAGQFPITNKPVTLNVMMRQPSGVKDEKTNSFNIYLEQKTGVQVDYTYLPQDGLTEKVNTLIASDGLPDILLDGGISMAALQSYGKQGLFLPLNELIDQYGYYIKQVIEVKPVVKSMISNEDGSIYTLPRVNECFHCFRGPKVWVYQPWMDKLGLKNPETLDDFYTMLKAFKEKDPNGNGKADEIAYTGSNIGWDNSDIVSFIMGAFMYNADLGGSYTGLALDKGVVIFDPVQPEYREGLRYLAKLYKEGLITDLTFTMGLNDYKRTVTHNPQLVGVAQSNYPGVFADAGEKPTDSFYSFRPLSPLKGPKGVRYASVWTPYAGVQASGVISAKNKYPAVSLRWLDTIMSPEATMAAEAGVEGINWVRAPAGTKTALGYDAYWIGVGDPRNPNQKKLTPAETDNRTWLNSGPTVTLANNKVWYLRLMGALDSPGVPGGSYEKILDTASRDFYEPFNPPIEKIMPPVRLAEADAEQVADLSAVITTYTQKEVTRFIRGERNLDTEWDSYLAELKNAGLDRFLAIYQKTLDRQKAIWNLK